MRRALALLLLAAAVAVAPACSGVDAQEAQQLLAESDAAFANVRSATFSASMTITGAGQELKMTMSGGGYAQGGRSGDFYVVATATNLPFHELALVKRGDAASMTVDGASLGQVPFPPAAPADSLKLVDYSRYVKDVHVEHGKLIDGEPMTKVSGVIDTAALVHGALGDLSGSGLNLADALGDTHLVLYLSDVTHLPMRGLVDLHMKLAGQKVEMHMDFAYTSYNEKLEFPGLS
ncbi:MAG TPA: hypothetical protein VE693_05735 [Gaiellaceae bacterium]|nr:hypothetical protein [Gaiellaceae bacterium]